MKLFLGLGSNLGDRQSNLLAALQRLRARARIVRVSSFYESDAAEGASGPAFLNAAAELETNLDLQTFRQFAADVQSAVGRAESRRLAARPIDIDVLLADGYVHPQLESRPYNLIPLAEIAPEVQYPPMQMTLRELAVRAKNGVRKRERALRFSSDRQEEAPRIRISLGRAGVSGLRRNITLNVAGKEQTTAGVFSVVADLGPDKSGVHMSRFAELLEEAALDVLANVERVSGIEQLLEFLARQIIAAHPALTAEVGLRAGFALERWTPVSGKREEETYDLDAFASVDAKGVRFALAVEAEGMTACPCAQGMVHEQSLHDLIESGFSRQDAQRALSIVPAATHNQRGRGRVLIGPADAHSELRLEDLVEIVEAAMSSETYDLLKRPDELFVVNKAHRNAKFVEDVARDIVANALEMYADFPDSCFVSASQTNYESIHKHDAFAQTEGTFGEFRQELRSGKRVERKTALANWLSLR